MRRKLLRALKRTSDKWRPKAATLRWVNAGRPSPPPPTVKTRNILVLADIFNTDTLVETGTYRGEMIAATLHRFEQIYSIEIDPRLAKAARARFSRVSGKVHILEGDSGTLLPEIIRELPERTLFWLDGHYSGKGTGKGVTDTPILAEVQAIASLRGGCEDVIIIDDARLFGRAPAYPRLDDFVAMLGKQFGGQIRVADDSIFVLPRSPGV